jgi:hypothetical protein
MDYFHKVPVILQDEIRYEPPWQPRSVQTARDKSAAVVMQGQREKQMLFLSIIL